MGWSGGGKYALKRQMKTENRLISVIKATDESGVPGYTAITITKEVVFMIRKIIHIDENKCDGCGACVNACHEGAIALVDGKARLTHEHYCDGLGDCLPACHANAITFEEREAPAYDEAAVLAAKAAKAVTGTPRPGGCPGAAMRQIRRAAPTADAPVPESQLTNWPVQIKLAPVVAPYFDDAALLVAADCSAFTYAGFHSQLLAGRVCLIGCPKLDAVDYTEKLTEIISRNNIRSLTIVRMEVPCCGGLEMAAKNALQKSGKFIPWQVVTVNIDGSLRQA